MIDPRTLAKLGIGSDPAANARLGLWRVGYVVEAVRKVYVSAKTAVQSVVAATSAGIAVAVSRVAHTHAAAELARSIAIQRSMRSTTMTSETRHTTVLRPSTTVVREPTSKTSVKARRR